MWPGLNSLRYKHSMDLPLILFIFRFQQVPWLSINHKHQLFQLERGYYQTSPACLAFVVYLVTKKNCSEKGLLGFLSNLPSLFLPVHHISPYQQFQDSLQSERVQIRPIHITCNYGAQMHSISFSLSRGAGSSHQAEACQAR